MDCIHSKFFHAYFESVHHVLEDAAVAKRRKPPSEETSKEATNETDWTSDYNSLLERLKYCSPSLCFMILTLSSIASVSAALNAGILNINNNIVRNVVNLLFTVCIYLYCVIMFQSSCAILY